ncbi:MAG: alpha/beta hydrolase [Amaricoccus sp.]
MVVTDAGVVAAANQAMRIAFGLFPGGSISQMPLVRAELDEFGERVRAVALASRPLDDVVRLNPDGRRQALTVHLRTVFVGDGRPHALAVSTEVLWKDEVGRVLARVFALTGAEIALVRRLAAGEAIRDVAEETGRTHGTMRSQLHSIFGKTGTCTQGELVRLAMMLLQAVALDPGPARTAGATTRRHQHGHIRLADGRKLAVLQYGDPSGRPVLWLQSAIGYFQPTSSGERELVRRGLRTLVPIRAGYATSDPAPPGRDVLEVAVGDIAELLRQLGVARCPVVAPAYDVRIALMLAQHAPERVERIVGVACMFPILSNEQYRRLHPMPRFHRAAVRYAPYLLPFITRAWHAHVRRTGLRAAVERHYPKSQPDACAIADPEIEEAFAAAYALVYSAGAAAEAEFCTECIRFEQRWPAGLGDVSCPVTLVHGEKDPYGPYETALDYAAAYPAWRVAAFADAGQLVGYTRWNEVLDAVEGSLAEPTRPALSSPERLLAGS